MPYEIRQGDIPGIQLRCDRRYAVSAASLWEWLVDPERMRLWLADEIEEGSEGLRFVSTAEDGAPLVERGRTLVRDERRLWVLAFDRPDAGWAMSTELRFELTDGRPAADDPQGGEACGLDVLHRGFERLALSSCLSVWEMYRRRWRGALERLATAIG